ncbi:MAG: zinc ribbon domain-containing protein [Promethearchaeota archaeon]
MTRILQTIEQEKKEKEESITCPYCKESISNQEEICPNCGSSLKE